MVLFIAALLGPVLIRTLGFLCRYEVNGQEHFERTRSEGKGLILTLWHGRMLLPVYYLRNRGIVSLVSHHIDGEIITRIVQRLGYVIRRGSPREGGMEGFREMLHDLKAGRVLSIFPDGPTGPRHSIRDGVIHLARLTGAPLVPLVFSAHPSWRAKSWDKYMIMKPFSKGLLQFGEPIYLPRKISREGGLDACREQIRQVMIDMEQALDRQTGVEDIENKAEK